MRLESSLRRPSRLRRPMVLASAMALSASLLSCGEAPEAVDVAPRVVRHMVVEAGGAGRLRTFSGTSRSSQESRLSFRVAGTIERLPVAVGDRLRRGDLVATLSPDRYELQAQRAQADLAQARANERNSAAAYERTKELYTDDNAAKSDLDAARAGAESARAQVGAAEKQLELARLDISYTRLTAATACSVASVEVEVNENVASGTTVATVTCGSQLEVGLAMPEGLIGEVIEGMPATVRFSALPGESLPATVTEVGVAAGATGATFPVTVTIDSANGLRSGLAAEVDLRFAPASDIDKLLVPLTAVIEGTDGTHVFIALPIDGDVGGGDVSGRGQLARVERRDVELGALTAAGIEVASGLEPGDRVITAGTSFVRDGLEVRLAPATAAPATATAPAGR